MAKSVASFIEEIQPIIRDRTNTVVNESDFIDFANRAARELKNKHGIYAVKNRADIFIFPDVYEYPLPSDFHSIRELKSYSQPITFNEKIAVEFWRRYEQERNIVAVDTVLGSQFLLCSMRGAGSKSVAHTMDSLTDNGTWAAVGTTDAENIAVDTFIKKSGSGSISFDVDVSNTVANTAAIQNSTLSALDWTDFLNKGTLFVDVYLPSATYITNITAYWGSSSSDYYSNSATTQYNGQTFTSGFNRVGIAWSGATTTGSPVVTAIDYLYLQVTYSASQTDMTGVRFDTVFMALPEILSLQYYSTHFVLDGSDSTTKEQFEDTSDLTLLENDDDDVVYYFMLKEAQKTLELYSDMEETKANYKSALETLKYRYPSERKAKTVRYY